MCANFLLNNTQHHFFTSNVKLSLICIVQFLLSPRTTKCTYARKTIMVKPCACLQVPRKRSTAIETYPTGTSTTWLLKRNRSQNFIFFRISSLLMRLRVTRASGQINQSLSANHTVANTNARSRFQNGLRGTVDMWIDYREHIHIGDSFLTSNGVTSITFLRMNYADTINFWTEFVCTRCRSTSSNLPSFRATSQQNYVSDQE